MFTTVTLTVTYYLLLTKTFVLERLPLYAHYFYTLMGWMTQ